MSYTKAEERQYKQFERVIKNTDKALDHAFWVAKFANYNDKNFTDSLDAFKFHSSKVIIMSKNVRALL